MNTIRKLLCNDNDCKSKVLCNPKKNQCKVCLSIFCSSLCLINHLTSYHKEKHSITSASASHIPSSQSYLTGQLIPLQYTTQNEAFYNIENFEKVLTPSKKFHILGSGGFSTVYLVKHKKNEAYFAMKEMNKASLRNLIEDRVVRREMEIHITLSHVNICKLFAYREDKTNFYMIMEYESNGNLFNEIQKEKKALNESKAYEYFVQVCFAVAFLHSNSIIHRDIKPENCLLDTKKQIKLCDFGWTTEVTSNPRTTFCGTFEYMAPEIIQNSPYTKSVDMWSLGILLYELLHGYSPFRNSNIKNDKNDLNSNAKEIMRNIIGSQLVFHNNTFSDEVKDLISQLLNPNQHKRMTIDEVFSHSWMRKYASIGDETNENPSARSSTIVREMDSDNLNLFDTVCIQLSKKNKNISPINKKNDFMEGFSLYKEIKELEKEIDAKSNEMNKKQKSNNDKIENQKISSDTATTTTSIKNVLFTNCSLIANEDTLCPRKPKKKIVKKIERKDNNDNANHCSNINQSTLCEISTQTDLGNTMLIPEPTCKTWDLLNLFQCGR